jgi:hypothetical protein
VQVGRSNFISRLESDGAVAVASSAVLGGCSRIANNLHHNSLRNSASFRTDNQLPTLRSRKSEKLKAHPNLKPTLAAQNLCLQIIAQKTSSERSRLTTQAQPRRTSDVVRECGTGNAIRRWLQRLVRRRHLKMGLAGKVYVREGFAFPSQPTL